MHYLVVFFAFSQSTISLCTIQKDNFLLTDKLFFFGLKVRLGRASRMLTNGVGVVSTK